MSIYRGRNRKDFALASALYDAIEDNDVRGVSCILTEKGADPNIILPSTGISPFHLAIGNDSEEFALNTTKLILQHGGDPNIQTDDGLTPLHITAAWGRIAIVELLIHCGADPEIRDNNYRIPLDYAIDHQHMNVARLIHQAMYSDIIIWNSKEKENYVLNLEKIIINNGAAEAEYEVDTDKEHSLELKIASPNLEQLPQTKPNEYVQNWRETHAIESQLLENKENEFESKVEPEQKEVSFNTFSCSSISSRTSPRNFDFVNCDRRPPNNNVIENISLQYESSNKYKLRKTLSQSKAGIDIPKVASSFGKDMEVSRESGIVTLPNSTQDISDILSEVSLNLKNSSFKPISQSNCVTKRLPKCMRDTSSDYFTCNEISGSTNILEQNIFDTSVSPDKNNLHTLKCKSRRTSHENEMTTLKGITNVPVNISDDVLLQEELNKDSSLVSIAEVYRYTDDKEGVVLLEKRLLVNQKSDANDSALSTIRSQSSKLSSLPPSFDYDADTLRRELTRCGFDPGPITRTTKRVYLKKLYRLQKQQKPICSPEPLKETNKVFSIELEKTLKNPSWSIDLAQYRVLEEVIFKDFSNPDPSRKWREGLNKSSFTYLLLDPRITNNLPARAEQLSSVDTWSTFVSSIFYVGKGKRTRPYSHLYEAAALWNNKTTQNTNEKLQCILSIWKDNCGVICLHVFQNVIPVEAYTREAAMINALKLSNIKNKNSGNFYGTATTWSTQQQKMLGVFLLYKAMLIFLNEGERQIRPADID